MHRSLLAPFLYVYVYGAARTPEKSHYRLYQNNKKTYSSWTRRLLVYTIGKFLLSYNIIQLIFQAFNSIFLWQLQNIHSMNHCSEIVNRTRQQQKSSIACQFPILLFHSLDSNITHFTSRLVIELDMPNLGLLLHLYRVMQPHAHTRTHNQRRLAEHPASSIISSAGTRQFTWCCSSSSSQQQHRARSAAAKGEDPHNTTHTDRRTGLELAGAAARHTKHTHRAHAHQVNALRGPGRGRNTRRRRRGRGAPGEQRDRDKTSEDRTRGTPGGVLLQRCTRG